MRLVPGVNFCLLLTEYLVCKSDANMTSTSVGPAPCWDYFGGCLSRSWSMLCIAAFKIINFGGTLHDQSTSVINSKNLANDFFTLPWWMRGTYGAQLTNVLPAAFPAIQVNYLYFMMIGLYLSEGFSSLMWRQMQLQITKKPKYGFSCSIDY